MISSKENTFSYNEVKLDTEFMDIQDPNELEIIYKKVVNKIKKSKKRIIFRLMINIFNNIKEFNRDILLSIINISLKLIFKEYPVI